MKYLVKFFVVTFIFFFSTNVFAEQKIAYLDMTFVLNNSKAGKGAQEYLKKTFNENQKKFADLEKKLKKEEVDLLAKKTVLNKEEYQKKTEELRKKVMEYQISRRSTLERITSLRAEARKTLLDKIDPILNAHISENDISLVIDKKFTLGGNQNLDITSAIVEKLNKELPSLNLK